MGDRYVAVCLACVFVSGIGLIQLGFARMEQQGYGRASTGAVVVVAQQRGDSDLHGSASSGSRDLPTTMKCAADQGAAP